MKNNTTQFEYIFPLIENKQLLGELTISGNCWECEAGNADGFLMEPFGFDIVRVGYRTASAISLQTADVTGLYEYLLSNTLDGVQNFEDATVQHVAGLYEYRVTAIAEQKDNIILVTPNKAA